MKMVPMVMRTPTGSGPLPASTVASKAARDDRGESAVKTEKREKRLVLIVDDFEDNRAMYSVFLAYSGYDVLEASDGVEAVEVASRALPDIVVMDLSLPLMDGWEATRRLKGDARTRHIPIIALTGHALSGHTQDAAEAGCDAFLAKPCRPESLVEKVQELLRESAPKS
jgi:CheY-like chemotaxis protein